MAAKKYKLMIVEDEGLIRENIRKSIPWEKYSYEFCGEASNGEQALDIIEDIQPDVVITDIRMPFMDGIEFSRVLKSLYPKIKIIILSGHMEFAYAKEAISIGVYEYILKPITPVKLIRTLLKLKEVLDGETDEKEIIRFLTEEIKTIESKAEKEPAVLRMKDLINEKAKEKKLLDFLRFGQLNAVESFLSEYLADQQNVLSNSTIYCSYFGIKTVATCIQVIEEFGGEPEKVFLDLSNVNDYVKKFIDANQVLKETHSLIEAVLNYRNTTINSSAKIIDEAKKYILENLSKPDLSLNNVANHVGLSPNYFSHIFKKTTGETFVRIVTKTRIEQAKRLLKTTNMTTSDIAEKVGFSDTNYFISVFRRCCGKTTKAYRTGSDSSS